MIRVLATSCTKDGWIRCEVADSMRAMSNDPRVNIEIMWPQGQPFVSNLHKTQQYFLTKDFDFWINMDADNPPRRNPIDLVMMDLDIVGLPTPVLGFNKGEYPWYWNALYKSDEGFVQLPPSKRSGLQEVAAVGGGCFVIARRVLEKIPGLFMREWDKNGIATMGNDYAMCVRAKESGFRIWTHFGYPCSHFFGSLDYLKVIEALSEVNG